MFILGVTGLLLTWKNQLQFKPETQSVSSNHRPLISLDKITKNAIDYIKALNLNPEISRVDYRPNKGIAKIRFENHFTELQMDCYTGNVISEKQRTADIIEMIHDGSILDYLFKNQSKPLKLLYSSATSLALILLSFSGFWLWLKPKQIKKIKR